MDMSGVPFGQTMSLAAVMWLSNHPKVAGVATTIAAAALTGGAGAGAAAGGAARAGVVAEGAAARGGMAGARAATATAPGRMVGEVGGRGLGFEAETAPAMKTGAFPQGGVSEEALGARRESIEQVMDIMERMPEPERRGEEDEEEEDKYRLAA